MLGPFLWSSRDFGKNSSISGEDLFFGLHLICLPEKDRGQGSFPPTLKIGQNWGKIANYPPNAQQRLAPLLLTAVVTRLQKGFVNKTEIAGW